MAGTLPQGPPAWARHFLQDQAAVPVHPATARAHQQRAHHSRARLATATGRPRAVPLLQPLGRPLPVRRALLLGVDWPPAPRQWQRCPRPTGIAHPLTGPRSGRGFRRAGRQLHPCRLVPRPKSQRPLRPSPPSVSLPLQDGLSHQRQMLPSAHSNRHAWPRCPRGPPPKRQDQPAVPRPDALHLQIADDQVPGSMTRHQPAFLQLGPPVH